jgi:hypothetical protein
MLVKMLASSARGIGTRSRRLRKLRDRRVEARELGRQDPAGDDRGGEIVVLQCARQCGARDQMGLEIRPGGDEARIVGSHGGTQRLKRGTAVAADRVGDEIQCHRGFERRADALCRLAQRRKTLRRGKQLHALHPPREALDEHRHRRSVRDKPLPMQE